jgi:hypothetical protein
MLHTWRLVRGHHEGANVQSIKAPLIPSINCSCAMPVPAHAGVVSRKTHKQTTRAGICAAWLRTWRLVQRSHEGAKAGNPARHTHHKPAAAWRKHEGLHWQVIAANSSSQTVSQGGSSHACSSTQEEEGLF